MLKNIYEKLGPLGPVFFIFVGCILVFTFNRIALGISNSESLLQTDNYLYYLPVGLRMDTIILCLFFSLPVLLTLLTPPDYYKYIHHALTLYLVLICTFFIFMEISSWPFLDQYSSRPNQLFFQYLTHPKEVFLMLWAEYKILLLITAIFLFYFVKYSWTGISKLNTNIKPWRYWQNLIALPVCIALLTLGARSGIGQANANPGLAAFSNNHITNQLSLNASYSLTYAYYTSLKSSIQSEELFGKMDQAEIIQRVKKYMNVPESDFTSSELPTLHIQRPTIEREKPLNLVIIVMEGLGSDYIGTLGGYNVTPNFDALSKEGILFTNLHSIGTRTSRGMEAMVSGYLPTSKSSSIMKLDLAQQNFFTIASLLKDFQYKASFIYGGEAHFDNMAAFFLGNGFDEIIDESDFEKPEYYGTWGVSDEDIFRKANENYRQQQDNFLSVILTVSNHTPFDFPVDKIQLHEQPANTAKNATKYSDYALGQFFELAKKEDYFKNTVFVITGDHPMLIRAASLVPVDKYKIPGLIIAPGLTPNRIDSLGSQIDLLPTALGLLGMNTEHPMVGRNLLVKLPNAFNASEASDIPNRQVSIYTHSMAFRTENKVVVFQPHKSASSFNINSKGDFIQTENDPELTKDALAHILFPGIAYRQQFYRQKVTNQ